MRLRLRLFHNGDQIGPRIAEKPFSLKIDHDDSAPIVNNHNCGLGQEQRTRLLPVVVLTSSNRDEDVVGSYSLGANAYVRKPVDFAEFVRAAQSLGLFWLVTNETTMGRPLALNREQ